MPTRILIRAAAQLERDRSCDVAPDTEGRPSRENFPASKRQLGGALELMNVFSPAGAVPFVSSDSKDAALLPRFRQACTPWVSRT